MPQVEMSGNGSFALPSFLAGLGIGVAVTLLLAPHTGATTRGLIGQKVKEGEDWVKGKAAEAEAYAVAQGTELRDRVKEVAEVITRG